MPERRWPKEEERGELEDDIMADAIPATRAKPTYICILKERRKEGWLNGDVLHKRCFSEQPKDTEAMAFKLTRRLTGQRVADYRTGRCHLW